MLITLFLINALQPDAHACDAVCQALKRATESAPYRASRPVAGVPQACLTLDLIDRESEVVLAVHYDGTQPEFSTRWRRGAALATGGRENVPMICIDRVLLVGATAIMVCDHDHTAIIRKPEKIQILRTRGRNPTGTAVCLKGSACAQ